VISALISYFVGLFQVKMVRKYKKKTDRVNISEEAIVQALNDYRNGNYRSIREAAEAHGLKKSTLHFRLSKIAKKENKGHESDSEKEPEDLTPTVKLITVEDMAPVYNSKYSHRQVFTPDQEIMIVDYCIERSRINYGLTYSMTRELAYKYAVALDLKERIPEKWHTSKSAGEEWMYHFMKRHPDLSLRQAENTSLSRNTSFNSHNVGLFFDNLETLFAKVNPPPSRIFSIDESGVSTVLEAPKVIAAKGTKQVGQVVSAERGEQVTMCGIICADGSFLPPVFVYPRKRPNPAYLIGAPIGSKDFYSGSGWMTGEVFLETLKHVQASTKCTKLNPIVVLLDNHESHMGWDVILYCRDNGIHLLTFHPHTTHRMQPIDVSVFGPFKRRLRNEQNEWLSKNPGHTITIREIAQLCAVPFVNSFTEANIKSGFCKTGIYPFNRNAFTAKDFKGASVTDQPNPSDGKETDTNDLSMPSTSTSAANFEDIGLGLPAVNLENSISVPVTPSNSGTATKQVISPSEVLPFPKYVPKTNKRGGRKKGRSRIITNTPEKNLLEEELKEKKTKLLSKLAKKANKEAKKTAKKLKLEGTKRNIFQNDDSTSNEDEMEVQYADFGDSPEEFSDDEEYPAPLLDRDFTVNDFVVTKFATKKTIKHFIAQIEEPTADGFAVKFLKKKDTALKFYFPDNTEKSEIDSEDLVLKLRQPDIIGGTSRAANCFSFKEDLSSFNLV
jgi:hypothetical protein